MTDDTPDSDVRPQGTNAEAASAAVLPSAEHEEVEIDKNALLYLAAKSGDIKTVRRLVNCEPPPDIDYVDPLGGTALQAASEIGNVEIMEILVKHDADLSPTALWSAARSNHLDAITYLVESSKERLSYVNSCDNSGHSAIHYAIWGEKAEALNLLIELGADLKLKDREGWTAAFYACSERRPLELLKILKNSGWKIDDQDNVGDTCLHIASRENYNEHVEWLLDNGADPSKRNVWNKTAWEVAWQVALDNSAFHAVIVFASKETHETEFYLKRGMWYHLHGGNSKIRICSFLTQISQDKTAVTWNLHAAIQMVNRNFHDGNTINDYLSSREPSCVFDHLVTSDDRPVENGSGNFVSLAMPFFYSTSPSNLQKRGEKFRELTQYRYCVCKDSVSAGMYLPLTLDEHCNPSLDPEILATRNMDQVVLRYQQKKPAARRGYKESLHVITVPQAWLWKVDNLVMTALPLVTFGENWSFNDMKFSWNLTSRERHGDTELALGMFLSELVDVLDRPDMVGPIFTIFEKAIADLSEEVNKYLKSTDVDTISIEKEKQFLHDIDDIREELSMIKTVLFQQEEVWKDFANKAWPTCWPDGPDGRFKVPEILEATDIGLEREIWRKIQKPQIQFAKFKRKISKLDEDAERVERAIDRKLDLKAKHASLNEAHATAVMSAAVFGFTIITIIFTPLSFIVSLFALPIDQFQQQQIQSVWTDQAGMYSTNYVGKWIATVELISVTLTLALMWFMVEYGMRVPITRNIWGWAKALLKKLPDAVQDKSKTETPQASTTVENSRKSSDEEQPKEVAKVSINQSKPEHESKEHKARYRKWFRKRENDRQDEETASSGVP